MLRRMADREIGVPGGDRADTESRVSEEGGAGREVGEFRFFGNGSGGLEVEMIAVRIGDGDVPEAVADERFFRRKSAREKFAVESNGVFALKPDGGTDSTGFGRDAAGIVLLQHERGATEFEPAPDDLVGGVGRPFIFESEAEAVDVEAEGGGDVGDHEEGNDELDVLRG
jgi:hypothetical protein